MIWYDAYRMSLTLQEGRNGKRCFTIILFIFNFSFTLVFFFSLHPLIQLLITTFDVDTFLICTLIIHSILHKLQLFKFLFDLNCAAVQLCKEVWLLIALLCIVLKWDTLPLFIICASHMGSFFISSRRNSIVSNIWTRIKIYLHERFPKLFSRILLKWKYNSAVHIAVLIK